jgi:hypothetical protein
LDGARRPTLGKHFVAAPSVNMKVVNRRALNLFPVTIMLKERFTAAQKKSAAPSM